MVCFFLITENYLLTVYLNDTDINDIILYLLAFLNNSGLSGLGCHMKRSEANYRGRFLLAL